MDVNFVGARFTGPGHRDSRSAHLSQCSKTSQRRIFPSPPSVAVRNGPLLCVPHVHLSIDGPAAIFFLEKCSKLFATAQRQAANLEKRGESKRPMLLCVRLNGK
jgi:hypothetical protein